MRVYPVLYVIFVFIGAVVNLQSVLDFGDMRIWSTAFPNLLGAYLLSGKVAVALEDYLEPMSAKKMPVYE